LIVVSDASPLITLAAVGRLELLPELYGPVCIPEQVYAECTRLETRLGARQIATAEWIRVQPASDRILVEVLHRDLDPGESEAIALALQLHADVILIDETRARQLAAQLGLHVVGVIGIVALAKRRGLIPSAREVIEAMKLATGFRIAPALLSSLLQSVDE
jgi:predicted nucleic acid-binding protein